MQWLNLLIPADGFYEWKKTGPGAKIPYCITRNRREPFAFASIWQTSADENSSPKVQNVDAAAGQLFSAGQFFYTQADIAGKRAASRDPVSGQFSSLPMATSL